VGEDFESISQPRCFNARCICRKRVYGVCAGHQSYVTAFRHQHSRWLRRYTNRTDHQSWSDWFRNKQHGHPPLAAQPVRRHGCRFRRDCYLVRLARDERPRVVELDPSRAEHETGGQAIGAETLRCPPHHPMISDDSRHLVISVGVIGRRLRVGFRQ